MRLFVCNVARMFIIPILLSGLPALAVGKEKPKLETPGYTVLSQYTSDWGDQVEVRRYEQFIQAVTKASGDNSGFRRLAGYIFGGNTGKESISMTAPVMTTASGGELEMAFMMPSAYDLDSLPTPDDAGVGFEIVPARTVATIIFSGFTGKSRLKSMSTRLISTLERQELEVKGQPLLCRYDPPWTLPFWRTNEIQYELTDYAPIRPAAVVYESNRDQSGRD